MLVEAGDDVADHRVTVAVGWERMSTGAELSPERCEAPSTLAHPECLVVTRAAD